MARYHLENSAGMTLVRYVIVMGSRAIDSKLPSDTSPDAVLKTECGLAN